jgi:hypothetical protein
VKPVPVYSKKYLKLQRRAAVEALAKAASAPAIEPSAQVCIDEIKAAQAAVDEPGGDRAAKAVRLQRAREAGQRELFKQSLRATPIVPAFAGGHLGRR